jgi:hypothetical protein
MAFTVCVRDRFGDIHASRFHGEANADAIRAAAREMASDYGFDDGEAFAVGVSPVADVGAARLRIELITWIDDLAHEARSEYLESSQECRDAGSHLQSCDEDGYCNACGEQ